MSDWRICLSDLDYGPEEEAAVLRVLRSRWLSMGPEVESFEREFAGFQGASYAYAVANGTTGLHLAMLALGLEPGDEVIQPAINFVATANMTRAIGATPVFADIVGLEEPTIDPLEVERLITARTRAVVVMHYGGFQCRISELVQLCRRHDLMLIEDACHAIGAENGDRAKAGSIGDIGVFSFFSNKNLATGEGGMVVTSRAEVADRVRQLRSHGMTTLTWDRHRGHATGYDVSVHGYNYRLDELHAALGRAQLAKLPDGNRRREELVRRYRSVLSDHPEWLVPFSNVEGSRSAYHLMAVVAADATSRDAAVQSLRRQKIQSSMHYPCIPDFSAFKEQAGAHVPRSRDFAGRIITLPLHPRMHDSAVEEVVAALDGASSAVSS